MHPLYEWYSDVLMSQLGTIGFNGFAETYDGFEAYIEENQLNENELKKTLTGKPEGVKVGCSKELIKDRNWNEEWELNYFKPLVISGECLIRAPFHKDYPECRYEIIIEPNMAFGTGNHETTSMMLEAIIKENMTGKNVLDMGCGTGILGILASMKGAAKITAIDIDEWPVKGTAENARLNKVYNLEVQQGDASLLGEGSYDIILANIHKNVLLNDIPVYVKCLNQNGKLFMSGIYVEDLSELTTRALNFGLKLLEYQEKNKWVMAAFQS